MKRKAITILLALLMVMGLTGCSSTESDSMAMENSSAAYDSYALYDSMGDYAPTEAPEASTVTETTDASGEVTEEFERKIVRNADISLEADDARKCYADLLAFARSVGGYESSCSVNARESEYSDYVYLNAVIKLPPEQLDAFMNKAGEVGTVTNSSVTSDEITAEYYDVQTRLTSLTAALDSYYTLLEKAETIEEVLSIQTRIDELVTEIEVLKGTLRLYNSMVDESTVNIYISQYNEVPAEEKEYEWDSLDAPAVGKLIKNGFLGVCNFLWSLLQWLAIIIISASPLLLVAGIILFFALRARKARKQRQKETPAPTAAAPAEKAAEGYIPPAEAIQK
ncbi:MAG: DUF4349 domain-containing protein [Ruminococcaceae bacterium]|nr:DUF4349 domain-containing protein [Oscillospiraceae bacterium]